jgi:hypothetical protein
MASPSGSSGSAAPRASPRPSCGGQLALFELLGSPDKELIGYGGRHGETKPQAIARWREFIAGHLTGH